MTWVHSSTQALLEKVSWTLHLWAWNKTSAWMVIVLENYQSLKMKVENEDAVSALSGKSLQWCLILYDTMDCSPPGFSFHGILQERILEWVAVPSSRGSSWPRAWTCLSYASALAKGSSSLVPPGKPNFSLKWKELNANISILVLLLTIVKMC